MSELNPLNDLSRVYLDHVAKINQKDEANDIKRWEEGNDALDKQMQTSSQQLATLGAPQMEEEVSYVEAYVTELKKTTLGSYVKKASKDLSDRRFDQGDSEKRKYDPDAADDKEEKKLIQREKGISRAATKLSKEEVVLEKDLSAAERRALPDSDFALPGKGKGPEGKQAGSYPIPDATHARAALAMVAKYGTPEEKEKVRAAVKRKFPDIHQESVKEDSQYGYDSKGRSKNPADVEKRKRKEDKLFGAPNKGAHAEMDRQRKAAKELHKPNKGAHAEMDRQRKAAKELHKPSVKKEGFSNWRQDLIEISPDIPVTDKEAEKKITEKDDIENKVVINPKMSEAVAQIGGQVISETEVELQEKDKDTPDQVKAVIAYDRARHATDDATYDTMHGKKKQAKKERDYAKWQRDTGARDAQKSGHPWEHEKYGTREKEGKKSVKHAHVKDSYDPLYNEGVVGKEVKELQKAGKTLKDTPVVNADKTDTPNYKGQKFGVKKAPSSQISAVEAKDWIQGAVKRPGAFTRKAKAADMSVQQFARHVDDNPGKYSTRTKKQANLAQTFASMKKEDIEEMFYHMIVEDDRLVAWNEFNEGYQRNPEEGERKERADAKKREAIPGQASRGMPPRGDKKREEFERWYAANVR